MIARSHKAKQYGLIALKVLLLCLTFGYIYWKLRNDSVISFSEFMAGLQGKNYGYIPLFILFALCNWIFEILKWQTVASKLRKMSFGVAAKQSLAALTASLATPNRIGDYGAKAFFFPAEERKQVLILNFFSNFMQLGVTILFGSIGLIYAVVGLGLEISTFHTLILLFAVGFIIVVGYIFREKELLIKGLSVGRVSNYFRSLGTSRQSRVLLFAFIRYLIFSSLFYLLLKFFNASITPSEAFPLIFSMYLLVSVVPTLFILDVVVRGGVAVYLFSLIGIPEWPVLATVSCMWILNFVLPALIGSYYLITYKRP